MSDQTADGIVFRTDADLRPEGRSGALAAQPRRLPRVLGPVGTDLGVPGAHQSPPRRRRRGARPSSSSTKRRHVRFARRAATRCRAGDPRDEGAQPRRSSTAGPRGAGGEARVAVASATSSSRCSCSSSSTAATTRGSARRPRSTRSRSWPSAATSRSDDADRLADAYRFLRTVEHRLQLVDEQQTHTLPVDRRLRGPDSPGCSVTVTAAATAVEQFDGGTGRTRRRALDPRATLLRADARRPLGRRTRSRPTAPRSAWLRLVSPTPHGPRRARAS